MADHLHRNAQVLNGVGFNFPLPGSWNGGLIVQMKLRVFYAVGITGNEVIRIRAGSFAAGGVYPAQGPAIATPEFAQTKTIQSSGANYTMQDITIALGSGITAAAGDTVFFRVERDAASGGNTCAASDLYLVHAALVWRGTGPTTGPWAVPGWPD